ncbi:MAG: RtcB family protein [Candidatus Zixiibacteriota bacterium]|nr:MAG: RtcB family protein [candidate division Zixibacteria bacterium]UCE25750.1 MAG: RtcB family protein [candidate division Zixibacteria bacterium]
MAWEGPIERRDQYRFEIPKSYQSRTMQQHGVRMSVPALIFADDRMLEAIKRDDSPEQVANVATLPGIVGRSIAMPDIHHGYGFAIGGVAAFDATGGVISPGGVGYDINCGVRLLRTDLDVKDIQPKIEKLVDTMFNNVPCGVGSEGKLRLSSSDIDRVLENGSRWAVESGYGWQEDLIHTEEQGCLEGGDASTVTDTAKKRGSRQLGTLGAGNHFLEIQRVDEIFDRDIAAAYGITDVDQVTVMIHTGSRGCGHQICTDYLEIMRRANKKYNIPLIDRELSCAPATSPEGQRYFAAMKCGANFAWANRQMITHWVRESFESVMKSSAKEMGLRQIYDIAHNIAKLEEHEIEGKRRWLYVHRKGATRAFGPGHPDIPERYRGVGQPVLIPGDMGTASYLLAGTDQAMKETFGSSCHGAGRSLSRHAARKRHPSERVLAAMDQKGIYLQAKSRKVISEEAPEAYKDIDEVVEISHQAGLVKKVVRMKPVGVVKG